MSRGKLGRCGEEMIALRKPPVPVVNLLSDHPPLKYLCLKVRG